MHRIGEIIRGKALHCARAEQSVLEISRYMAEQNVGAVPVVEGDRLVGIFSERDLMTRVVAQGLDAGTTRIGEVMTKDLVVTGPDETIGSCLRKMKQINARHLPVVSGNQLVGMVSMRDLLLVDLSDKDEEIKWLTAYIHYVPPGWEAR